MIEHTKEIKKCNELLGRELGRNPHNEPLYKWENSSNLVHYRFTGNQMTQVGHIYLPRPEYIPVRAYEKMIPADRWLMVFWLFTPQDEWLQAFGHRLLWSRKGDYWPTNGICRAGMIPNLDATIEFIGMVNKQRNTPVEHYENEWEAQQEARDRAVFNTIHDVITDACTAYGNDPGKRSGGVSFPSADVTKKSSSSSLSSDKPLVTLT